MAYDAEPAYFRGVSDVGPDACAGIVITYPYDTQGLGNVFRQFAQIHYPGSIGNRKERYCYR